MSKQIFEEAPEQKPMVGGGAKAQMQKQARQLAYDTKYKVKQSLGKQTSMNPAQVAKAYLAQLAKSTASPAVKALAKKIILGEEYTEDINSLVETTINNALYKVFVEGLQKDVKEEKGYLKELQEKVNQKGERLYHIKVTDKKSGNTYTRDATRAKIAELRANPNISSVEMSDYDKDSQEEKNKGQKTASVKSGKGLNNDGNLANNYPPYNKVTRGDVIAGATGKDQMGGKAKVRKEEFIGEVKDQKEDAPKVEGLKRGKKNKVKMFPEISEQTETETAPKTTSKKPVEDPKEKQSAQALDRTRQQEVQILQRKLQALRSAPKGTDPSIMASYEPEGDQIDEKITAKTDMGMAIKDFYTSKSPQLAGRTKEERRKAAIAAVLTARRGGKKLGEEACGCEDEKEPKLKKSEGGVEDPREIPTKVNMVKNKFRSMGLKMSYEPEGELVDEATAAAKRGLPDTHRPGREERASAAAASLASARIGKEKRLKAGIKNLEHKAEKEHKTKFPGSRQEPQVKGAKETPAQAQSRLASRHNKRVMKYGFTKKEKREDIARRPYDTPRD